MKTLTFKVTDDEERRIRSEARMAGTTLSMFLRNKVSGTASVEVTRSAGTGAPAFSSIGAKSAPLTTETVRAILADFP